MTPAPDTAHVPLTTRPWLAAWTLCQRELVRFVRQRNRVIGAIGQPLIFWLLFGAGLRSTFSLPGDAAGRMTYREYFLPGTLVLIVLFTAIFATISIIEDRREGFLQSVLVAPIPRWSMVLGKLVGGTLIALVQVTLFLALALTFEISLRPAVVLAVVGWLAILSFALTALGFVLAWRMESTQGFHAVMSVLLMPMWLLSGSFFPLGEGWLAWLMRANPLTYGVAALRQAMYWDAPELLPPGLPSPEVCWGVTLAFTAAVSLAAWRIAATRTTGDLL